MTSQPAAASPLPMFSFPSSSPTAILSTFSSGLRQSLTVPRIFLIYNIVSPPLTHHRFYKVTARTDDNDTLVPTDSLAREPVRPVSRLVILADVIDLPTAIEDLREWHALLLLSYPFVEIFTLSEVREFREIENHREWERRQVGRTMHRADDAKGLVKCIDGDGGFCAVMECPWTRKEWGDDMM